MNWLGLLPSAHSAILGTLGETVELVSEAAGSSASVTAIYKRPSIVTDEVGGVDYRGSDHTVTLRETDLPAWCDRGAQVVTSDRSTVITLDVVELVPDGQGLVTLWCRRAA